MEVFISTIVACFVIEKIILFLARLFGFYAIVKEREAKVFVLFGEIVGVIDTPGIHFIWLTMGWKAPLVGWLGNVYTRDLRLDQQYLRSIPVNSEEGTPMGIGVWYEMFITDPVAHIFKNVDPVGSLSANVKNATIKTLSNLPLAKMLVDRHGMSKLVREEVSPESAEWGYKLGSVYIRKVHFRDTNMIRQIEEKVVNQLRQVTSAIEQDGKNQVNIIASRADQEASVEFAKAAAVRPQIVSNTLKEISKDHEVLSTLFDIMETQRVTDGSSDLTIVPKTGDSTILTQLLAAEKNQK